eukprot:6035711-Amphidinium_carterae.2
MQIRDKICCHHMHLFLVLRGAAVSARCLSFDSKAFKRLLCKGSCFLLHHGLQSRVPCFLGACDGEQPWH